MSGKVLILCVDPFLICNLCLRPSLMVCDILLGVEFDADCNSVHHVSIEAICRELMTEGWCGSLQIFRLFTSHPLLFLVL